MFLSPWSFRRRSVLRKNTCYQGAITSAGVLEINGQVEGRIDHDGLLIIGPHGHCSDYIQAQSLRVAGKAMGQISVAQKLEILPGGCVDGTVTCASLRIHQGGVLLGTNQMEDGTPTSSAAPSPGAPRKRSEPQAHAAAAVAALQTAAGVLPARANPGPAQAPPRTALAAAGPITKAPAPAPTSPRRPGDAQPDGAVVFRGARRAPSASPTDQAAAEQLAEALAPHRS